jgi:hypothetical protein
VITRPLYHRSNAALVRWQAAMPSRSFAPFVLMVLGLGCAPHDAPIDGPSHPEPPIADEPERPTVAPVTVTATPGGCFADARSFDIGFPPFLADVADVDEDGALDLVAQSLSGDDLAFIAGDGAGGFAVRRRIEVENREHFSIVLGDVDSDDKIDLVTFEPRAGLVVVRRGDGLGDFARAKKIELRKQVYGGTLHDLDGDGVLDLVTQHLHALGIHRGRGDGGFATELVVPVAQAPEHVQVVDLDRDGALDIVAPSNDESALLRLHGTGTFSFARERRDQCGDGPHELAIADLDGDGRLDAAMATMHSHELCIFRQDDAGKLRLVLREPFVTEALDAADLDDDGTAELVIADVTENRLRVLALAKDTLVERGRTTTGHNPHGIWLRELDGDGRIDALMLDGEGWPESWLGDVRSFDPRDTTVSVALGRTCDP